MEHRRPKEVKPWHSLESYLDLLTVSSDQSPDRPLISAYPDA